MRPRKPRNREYEQLPPDVRAALEASRRILSPELRALILAAPIAVSNKRLAARYRISMRTIGRVRRAAGLISPGMRENAAQPGRSRAAQAPEMLPDMSPVAESHKS